MNTPAATIFYDGECPLCRREITHYRRLRGADRLLWIDITSDEATLAAHGLSREDAMARFHVRDAAGDWHTGAAGFVELWSHLRVYRWLASLLRSLRLVAVLDRAYTHFARWRLQRRCDADQCHQVLTSEAPHGANVGQRKTETSQ